KAEDDLYVYQKPKQGETPAVNIFASVIPVYRQQNSTFSTFAGMYSSTGGMPLDSVQNDVEWRIGLPEPTELNQMDISFSTYYDDNNLYAIAYSAVDMGEGGELVPYPDGGYFWSEGTPSIVKKVDVFLLPWIMHEKEELLPPYCRQQELPTEE
ncbi:MAG TPA: hypothetical protein PK303_09375, partial [bacterium]|nr:hypothetical protein [bacterium]